MKTSNSKTLNFLKRNAVYLILALCIVAIGVSALIYFLNDTGLDLKSPTNQNQTIENNDNVGGGPIIETNDNAGGNENPVVNPTDTDTKPVSQTVSFVMPVENASKIGEYSELPVFCSTLKRYQSHKSMDFFAPEGTNVLAVYGGKVESIDSTLLTGTTITIDHGNGLKSVYNSLIDGETVTVGQEVKQGDIIGQVGLTNRQEYKDGAHLHFEVIENGNVINPDKYLEFDLK